MTDKFCMYVCAHNLLHEHAVYICIIISNKSSIYTQVSIRCLYKAIAPVCICMLTACEVIVGYNLTAYVLSLVSCPNSRPEKIMLPLGLIRVGTCCYVQS